MAVSGTAIFVVVTRLARVVSRNARRFMQTPARPRKQRLRRVARPRRRETLIARRRAVSRGMFFARSSNLQFCDPGAKLEGVVPERGRRSRKSAAGARWWAFPFLCTQGEHHE